jgi:hypothetical protein
MCYQVVDVDVVLAESASCFSWKGGLTYHQIGWLRFTGQHCRFYIYQHPGGTILVTVEHKSTCDACIELCRWLTHERGYELVERRAHAEPRAACTDQGVASVTEPASAPASTPASPPRTAGTAPRSSSPTGATQRSPVGVSSQTSPAAQPPQGSFSQ